MQNKNTIVKVIHGIFKDIDDLGDNESNKIFNVTAIMRKSSVDFYYNFKYLNTLKSEVEDMELTFEDLYMKLKAPTF
jgi:hypothetical protein